MTEYVIIHSNLKYDQPRRQKPGDQVRREEMRSYCENLLEQQSSTTAQLTDRRGAQGSPDPRRNNKDPSATPLRWKLATIVLGILCLMLLIATGVLGYNEVQLGREQDSLVKQVEHLTSELMSCQTPILPVTTMEKPKDTGKKCPGLWTARQERSYLFSPEKGTWEQCNSSCISQSALLLMIESKEEQGFITARSFEYAEDRGSSAYYYPFWIGLSFDSNKRMWVWTDDSALSSGLFVLSDPSPHNYDGGARAYLQGDKVKPGGCGETRFCICEKKKKAQGKKKT
ncbi:hypothetical protein Y1Q_0008473 [Alligator mississippiensis]|uniref:C-type lectin domain-containing protein n=1 Tax=Alligator mississippiensis TaxID=8496 RepID=A0A151M1I2_ALLMI|nr:hypothetical protein Y1Q_0008473 [Alligator mississippiensis]